MQAETYGLTKTEYRKLIEDDNVTASNLAQKVIVPKYVYRYRRLGYENEKHKWVEAKHWEDDVNGICMFSKPDSFCKNDPYDCKVRFDAKKVFNYMFQEENRKKKMRVARWKKET